MWLIRRVAGGIVERTIVGRILFRLGWRIMEGLSGGRHQPILLSGHRGVPLATSVGQRRSEAAVPTISSARLLKNVFDVGIGPRMIVAENY
jgi:hypothetical protein